MGTFGDMSHAIGRGAFARARRYIRTTMPLTARSGAFSARSGCSSARSNRSGGGGARYDEMDLYFKEFGLADGSSLPGQSLASLSSEADEEERRQKAGAERQDREAKLLKMKAQRSQVAAKLDEWAANFRKAHGRDPTDADHQERAAARLAGSRWSTSTWRARRHGRRRRRQRAGLRRGRDCGGKQAERGRVRRRCVGGTRTTSASTGASRRRRRARRHRFSALRERLGAAAR